METPSTSPSVTPSLRRNYLSIREVIAQSVGTTAPSVTPLMVMPLVFAAVGLYSWLVYAFVGFALLLLTATLNIFVRRLATPGTVYAYVSEGLGAKAGLITGCAFLIGYIAGGATAASGFISVAQTVASTYFPDLPAYTMPWAGCIFILAAGLLAYKDVRLSTRITLLIELLTLSLIVIFIAVYLAQHWNTLSFALPDPGTIAHSQWQSGLILAFFSYVGFESATVLGHESRNPLIVIPRALIFSILIIAGIFVFSSFGLSAAINANEQLQKSELPLVELAHILGHPNLAAALFGGILFSFFASVLAALNATARLAFEFGTQGLMPAAFGAAHKANQTPHKAIFLVTTIYLALIALPVLAGILIIDSFSAYGMISTFGILTCYLLVIVAAPFFLHRLGALKLRHIALSFVSLLVITLPLIGSLYPVPDWPMNILPYIFLLTLVGMIFAFSLFKRHCASLSR